MTDKIRAALEEYTQIPFMSAMGESLNQCCRTIAGEGHADDCRGIEALREYDARATPALPQGVEEWINKHCCGAWFFDKDVLCVSADDLSAYLSGMAIVPVEPTRAMCKAATSYTHSHDAKLIYKAMLAAAKEKGE